eukprot:TRINITY_DN3389_c0_g1_i3.p1 TRINITY_DN3389_c0_g1~~TRINITY_DN3389_c0_g1_i3.p1  ORF type:complete len:427 (+),score=50.29 TRINITY_DN3389_c0_g1_i3:522-1802(+)
METLFADSCVDLFPPTTMLTLRAQIFTKFEDLEICTVAGQLGWCYEVKTLKQKKTRFKPWGSSALRFVQPGQEIQLATAADLDEKLPPPLLMPCWEGPQILVMTLLAFGCSNLSQGDVDALIDSQPCQQYRFGTDILMCFPEIIQSRTEINREPVEGKHRVYFCLCETLPLPCVRDPKHPQVIAGWLKAFVRIGLSESWWVYDKLQYACWLPRGDLDIFLFNLLPVAEMLLALNGQPPRGLFSDEEEPKQRPKHAKRKKRVPALKKNIQSCPPVTPKLEGATQLQTLSETDTIDPETDTSSLDIIEFSVSDSDSDSTLFGDDLVLTVKEIVAQDLAGCAMDIAMRWDSARHLLEAKFISILGEQRNKFVEECQKHRKQLTRMKEKIEKLQQKQLDALRERAELKSQIMRLEDANTRLRQNMKAVKS